MTDDQRVINGRGSFNAGQQTSDVKALVISWLSPAPFTCSRSVSAKLPRKSSKLLKTLGPRGKARESRTHIVAKQERVEHI